MSNNHSGKDHYKLYKAGKLWLTALVTTTVFGVALLGTQDASANTNPAVATEVTSDSTQGDETLQQVIITKQLQLVREHRLRQKMINQQRTIYLRL